MRLSDLKPAKVLLIGMAGFAPYKPSNSRAKATPERLKELRAGASERLRALNQDPEWRENFKQKREEKREQYREMMSKQRKDPAFNAKRLAGIKAYYEAKRSRS
jgi:hypothetical protein